jgi:tetratricopeptide (TPR) repeat protein
MLRVLALAIFLGISFVSYAEEEAEDDELFAQDVNEMILAYVGNGNAQLLLKDYKIALKSFKKASYLLDESNEDYEAIAFLINFGKVIAYDNLGQKDLSEQALAALLVAMNDEDETDDNEDIDENTKEVLDVMRTLASLAPSADIKEVLLFVVNEMEKDLYPPADRFEEEDTTPNTLKRKFSNCAKKTLLALR